MLFKYNQFINESKIQKSKIDLICKKYGIKNYTINNDGNLDVTDDVNLSYRALTKLPLKFGKVDGYFFCGSNKLTSLEGCPNEVGGDFYCDNNRLKNLKGCTNKVGGTFHCDFNELTSLEGCPKEVSGDFNCSFNKLKTLEGGVLKVGGDFWCDNNKLKNLKGCPIEVGGDFFCFENKIISSEGCATTIGGNIKIDYNPINEVFRLFPVDKLLEVIEYLNEYNVIRDGKKVVLQALEVVYDELGLEVPENIEIRGYDVI